MTPEQCQWLGDKIDKLEQMGVIEYMSGPPKDVWKFVSHINGWGVVPKGLDQWREILDLKGSGANRQLLPLSVELIKPEDILSEMESDVYLFKLDFEAGYYQVRLAPQARKLCGFIHPVTGRIGRYKVLPFGCSEQCALFCKLSNAFVDIVKRKLLDQNLDVKLFVYIDDVIGMVKDKAHLPKIKSIIDETARELGIQLEPRKTRGLDEPLQVLEVLGLTFDQRNCTMFLDKQKREQIAAGMQAFLQETQQAKFQPVTLSTQQSVQLRSLVGKVGWACRAQVLGYAWLTQVNKIVNNMTMVVDYSIWQSLKTISDLLLEDSGPWQGKTKKWQNRITMDVRQQLQVFTDASNKGLGAIIGDEQYFWEWDQQMGVEGSTIKELWAVFKALEVISKDTKVYLRTDNQGVVSALKGGTTQQIAVQRLLINVVQLILGKNILVKCEFIKGKYNVLADRVSRRQDIDIHDWAFCELQTVCLTKGWDICKFQVECFAQSGGINIVCPKVANYFTSSNTFEQNLNQCLGKICFAHPPFTSKIIMNMCQQIVEVMQSDQKQVFVVVLPKWETAIWYKRFINAKNPLIKCVYEFPVGQFIFNRGVVGMSTRPILWPVIVGLVGREKRLLAD